MREYLIENYSKSEVFLTLPEEFNAVFQEIIVNKKKDVALWHIGDSIVVKHNLRGNTFSITVDGKVTTKHYVFKCARIKLLSLTNKVEINRDQQYNKVTDMRTIAKLKGLVKTLESGESLSKAAKLVNLDYTTAKMFKNNELGITGRDLV